MDLELWYAEETDAPYYIKVNNSTTSSYEDNIQHESSRALARSPWKSWNFKKVAHVVWFVALFAPSFVYSYGQWPRTPVHYLSKLTDIAAKVLIFALYVWTLFIMLIEEFGYALCPYTIPPQATLCRLWHLRLFQHSCTIEANSSDLPRYICACRILALTPEHLTASGVQTVPLSNLTLK